MEETKYYIIRITREAEPINKYHPKTWYHSAGRGNGAFANMYEEHQVKRILGQYKNSKGLIAEAVQVLIVEDL